MDKKITYDAGRYYAWEVDAPFDYKNFVVSSIGVHVLFKLCKDNKAFYFTACEEEKEYGILPDKALFNEFYVCDLINMVLDPSEKEVIWSEPNYPKVGEAFKRGFGFMTVIENYFIEGTFLPPQYIAVPSSLEPYLDLEGCPEPEKPYLKLEECSAPLHIPFPVTREEFIEIALSHKAYGYGDPAGCYTKERLPSYDF